MFFDSVSSSFQRQLYFYGFTRQAKGPLAGSYFHPNFRRDKKFLCLSLTTKKAKSNFFAATTIAVSSEKGKTQNDNNVSSPVSRDDDARNDTARRVSQHDGDSFLRQADSEHVHFNTEMMTTTTSPTPTRTTNTTATTKYAPSTSSMVPRVSIDYKDERGRARPPSFWFDYNTEGEYIGDYHGYHSRHHHHSSVRQHSSGQRHNHDQRHSTFYPREGDTCHVFDDMTFHFVEHGG